MLAGVQIRQPGKRTIEYCWQPEIVMKPVRKIGPPAPEEIMLSRRKHKTTSLVVKATELAFAAPQVVAHRLARMAIAGPTLSRRDRKEFKRMSAEKTEAFSESWNAMSKQVLDANQALAASIFCSFWLPSLRSIPSAGAVTARLQGIAVEVLGKGLSPVHRRAVANAKRLARTKLR
jgi:hypothetical protein